ncbi:hypothetical protein SKAU_G00322040 [Synaphobranchus kaupii]|uniref:Ig-like domain-containing protein n=1 Tax=Synaphobranchus kaupii TaxID=118154 RepID=A0A9Q1EP08_SYNKA|nr:hypothetical protein SKAU_G00322040 [Synaphobranchus kaupii]
MSISVKAVESSFFISASSRTPSVTYGDSFDLQCIVKLHYTPSVPITVTWRFQPQGGGGRVPRPGNSDEGGHAALGGAAEGGTYQCSAQLWRRSYDNTWSKIANRTSNLLGINVLKPVSKLRLQKANQSLSFLEDSRVRVNCSIVAQTSPDSQHTVLWYARKGAEPDSTPELLLKISHVSGFEYGAYAEEEELKRRVQSERLSPQLYGLTLHRAELSDSGTYYCQVEEWLLDPDAVWYPPRPRHLRIHTCGRYTAR